VRLLLDTHAFLWWLDGDRRLPARVRRRIEAPAATVYVSAASAWEITTKWRLGRLDGAEAVALDVAGAIAGQGFAALDISVRHAEEAGRFTVEHRDPFDRMLAAQSRVEGVALVTNDDAFAAFAIERFW
jgi:PIN domain nuclease of toxin-antitoxin system